MSAQEPIIIKLRHNGEVTEIDVTRFLSESESRGAAIIRSRFGIDGESKTLEEIAHDLKITLERTTQIFNVTLSQLLAQKAQLDASNDEED